MYRFVLTTFDTSKRKESAMKILITGATGLIGRKLCHSLTGDGHTVVAVSRSPEKVRNLAAAELLKWDTMTGLPPAQALSGVDGIVHLAGEPVADKAWSDEQKKRIKDSRVISTRNLVDAVRAADPRPPIFVSASAVGYYGDRGDEKLYEESPPGKGFLSEVCQVWEREAEPVSELGVRLAVVRIGVVLSLEGGAMPKMLAPVKLGVGGPLGSGRQWFPWIHIDDIIGILRHAISTETLAGPINGAAPEEVTNAEFTRQLARMLGRPAFLPTPEFALKLIFGERAAVLLASNRVIPKVAEQSGYKFKFANLTPALKDLLS